MPIVVKPSSQFYLTREDLERILGSEPVRDVDDWLAREQRDFSQYEPDPEDLLYLTAGDVEKYSDDQPREPAGGPGGGQWTSTGGGGARAPGSPSHGATNAAARAHGWRPSRLESTDSVSVYTNPDRHGSELEVYRDGSWKIHGPDVGEFMTPNEEVEPEPTLASGRTDRDLDRHMGGESEQIPAPDQDVVGARELDQRDVSPSRETVAWLEEVEKDPDVARARELMRTATSTHRIYANAEGAYEPERAAMHARVAEEMLKPGAARRPGQQKTAVLMIGPGGAGKTTTLRQVLRKPESFSIISADYAKERMPGYDGYNAGVLHEESTHIADHVAFGEALRRGHNIVLDATGKTSSKYEAMAEKLHQLGYNVQALHVDVPTDVAARRAYTRFKRMKAAGLPPRYSDLRRILYDTDAKPTVTYNNLKARGLLSRAMEYDGNVGRGEDPRKVEDISYRRLKSAAPPGRDGAAGRAPGGGHPQDAGPGAVRAGAEVALAEAVGKAVAEAIRAGAPVSGPAVARSRKVRKTVVRDENNRIREVIEEEIE